MYTIDLKLNLNYTPSQDTTPSLPPQKQIDSAQATIKDLNETSLEHNFEASISKSDIKTTQKVIDLASQAFSDRLIQAAINEQHWELVFDLIKCSDSSFNPNLNIIDTNGNSLLMLAIEKDAPYPIIEHLVTVNQLDTNTQNYYQKTALHLATELGNLEVVQLLLKHGANPRITDKPSHMTPLMHALKNQASYELIEALALGTKKFYEAQHPGKDSYAVLFEQETAWGVYTLHLAVRHHTNSSNKDPRAVTLLLDMGAYPQRFTRERFQTPLMYAVAKQASYEVVEALLKALANLETLLSNTGLIHIDVQDASRNSALMHAVANPLADLKVVKLLLEYGANPDLQGELGRTALMQAISKHAPEEVIALLVSKTANLNIKDIYSQTALDIAKSVNNVRAIELLNQKSHAEQKNGIVNKIWEYLSSFFKETSSY